MKDICVEIHHLGIIDEKTFNDVQVKKRGLQKFHIAKEGAKQKGKEKIVKITGYCNSCGGKLYGAMAYCSNCGAPQWVDESIIA